MDKKNTIKKLPGPEKPRRKRPSFEMNPADVFEAGPDGVYTWKFNGKVAIEDKGDEIRVRSDHATAAKMAVKLAQDKGWSGLDLSQGSDQFRSAAWLEAQRLGLKTTGYQPSQTDLQTLQALVEKNERKLQEIASDKAILEKQMSATVEKMLKSPSEDANILRELKQAKDNPRAKNDDVLDRLLSEQPEARPKANYRNKL